MFEQMREDVYAAFHRISEGCVSSFGDIPKNDLITLGKAAGVSEDYLKEEFPDLFESSDSDENEKDEDSSEKEERDEELDDEDYNKTDV